MLQGKKKKGDNSKVAVSLVAQLHKRKKATVTAIAFFAVLRCNATKQEEEEGNDNIVVVTFFFAPSCITRRRRRRRRRQLPSLSLLRWSAIP